MSLETQFQEQLNISNNNIDPYFNVDWTKTEAKTPEQLLHKLGTIPNFAFQLRNGGSQSSIEQHLHSQKYQYNETVAYLMFLISQLKYEMNEIKEKNNELVKLNSDLIKTIQVYKTNNSTSHVILSSDEVEGMTN